MSGQISIRLSSDVIERLDRTAKKLGIKRAELVRSTIENGLDALADGAPRIEDQLQEMKTDILNSMSALPFRLRALLNDPPPTRADPETDETREALTQRVNPSRPSADLPNQSVRVEDDSASEERSNGTPHQDEVPSIETPTRKASQNGLTESHTITRRLKRALERMTGGLDDMAQELNMKRSVLEEVLSEKRKVPLSRAIRVEAKLQQWEAEESVGS